MSSLHPTPERNAWPKTTTNTKSNKNRQMHRVVEDMQLHLMICLFSDFIETVY